MRRLLSLIKGRPQNLRRVEAETNAQESPRFVCSKVIISPHEAAHSVAPKQQVELPTELILLVLQHLVSGMYSQAFTSSYRGTLVIDGPDVKQLHLLSTMTVCKLWNSTATAVLYSRPFIISNLRLALFTHTLQTRPALAPLVQEVYIFDQELTSFTNVKPRRQQGAFRMPAFEMVKGRSLDPYLPLAHKHFTSFMRQCHFVQTLVVTTRDTEYVALLPLDTRHINDTGISRSLRRLMISGWKISPNVDYSTHDPFLSPDVSLPILEVLSIRDVKFKPKHTFPSLPKLHTLQISESILYSTDGPQEIDLEATKFPALRVLHLFDNTFKFVLTEALLVRLQTLEYVVLRLRDSHMVSLKTQYSLVDLTIGPMGHIPSDFHRVLTTVQTFTIVVSLERMYPPQPWCTPTQELAKIIPTVTPRALRIVQVYIRNPFSASIAPTNIRQSMHELQSVCEAHDITLSWQLDGE